MQLIEAEESDYLYTERSQITGSGTGLFTAITIYKDEIIATFAGEKLSKAQVIIRTKMGVDDYFINLPGGGTLDSMHVDCFAKFANDPSGVISSAYKSNASIVMDEEGRVCIIAKRKINPGEEVFCGYGKNYWIHFRKKLDAMVLKAQPNEESTDASLVEQN